MLSMRQPENISYDMLSQPTLNMAKTYWMLYQKLVNISVG